MPLGVREILFIMRARDEASRTITSMGAVFGTVGTRADALAGRMVGVGSALSGIGLGMAGLGALGLAAFNKMADAAIEYRQQAALTLTQVDGFKVSLKDVERVGLEVAKAIPAPLEELQPALFDIFSSMDVGIDSAEKLLRGFAKSAIAGQVDVQTAGRATIAILNGFKIPISDVNRVLDVQFQLVRKGVGTYEEFARTIGLSIPSAVRAGQTVETLAGMLAFLTRNGLSASRASTSAARALDSMSNPIVVKRMEDMGIAVRDSAGEFRPMTEIVGQLSAKLENMTSPERSAALRDLFLGAGGTIQARRFWDLAVTNFSDLEKLVISMGEGQAAGAMQKAYDIMFKQPQSQMQLFQNRVKALEIEIGEGLIPVKMKLLEIGNDLINMWNGLPDGIQTALVWFGIATAALLLLAGTITAVTGALMTMKGMWMLMKGPEIASGIASLIAGSGAFETIALAAMYAKDAIAGWISANLLAGGSLSALMPVLGVAALQFAGLFTGVGLLSYGILKLGQHFGLFQDPVDKLAEKVAKSTEAFAKHEIRTKGLIDGYISISREYDKTSKSLDRVMDFQEKASAYTKMQVDQDTRLNTTTREREKAQLAVAEAYFKLTDAQKKQVSVSTGENKLLQEYDFWGFKTIQTVRELKLRKEDLGKILTELEPKYRKQIEAWKESQTASDRYAASIGVTLPTSLNMTAKAAKEFQEEITKTTMIVGADMTSLTTYFLGIENSGDNLVAALASINESSIEFGKNLSGSVMEFTDVWKHFEDATEVGVEEMKTFFVDSRQQAIDWMADVQEIIRLGVDSGIVQQLAQAGPKSEPAVKAFIEMVNTYGKDFVNNWQNDMDAAVAATQVAFTEMEIAVAIHSESLAIVAKAAMQDLKEGGTAHLEALKTQGSGEFRQLATDAITQLGRIRAEAGVPMPPIVIDADVSPAQTKFDNFMYAASLRTLWVNVEARAASSGDFGGLSVEEWVTRAHGGIIPGAYGQAVPILAHAGEYVLSRDVVDRIKRNSYSEGARMDAPMRVNMSAPRGGDMNINVTANTNADPYMIGRELAWTLMTNPYATHTEN